MKGSQSNQDQRNKSGFPTSIAKYSIPRNNPYAPRTDSQTCGREKSNSFNTFDISVSNDNMSTYDKVCASFDQLILLTQNHPLQYSIETAVSQLFSGASSYLWINEPDLLRMYSPTRSKFCTYQDSIVGEAYTQQRTVTAQNPTAKPSFNSNIDFTTPSIYIPLIHINNTISGVLQIVTDVQQMELEIVKEFSKKFKIYSHLLFPTINQEVANDLLQVGQLKSILGQIMNRLRRFFKCRTIELWSMSGYETPFSRYNYAMGQFESISPSAGVVTNVLKNKSSLNCPDVTRHPDYFEAIDGPNPESLLIQTLVIDSQDFAIVLRGKESAPEFSYPDHIFLQSFTPLIGMSISNALSANRSKKDNQLAERLKALLEVAEIISGVLDIDVLIPTIMERACSLLNTERCSLFLVDQVKQELVTRFTGGLDKQIRMQLNRGIVGHTATTGNIVNITDAYSDPRFDKAVDLATGFSTRTILTVPIYNNRGEIAAVTEMINRQDGQVFDEDDIKMMMAFNVFCGISLDNARMYTTSLDLTRQLRGFVEMSSALNKTKTVKDVIMEILDNAKSVIHANRATIFLRDVESDELVPYLSIGNPITHGHMFATDIMNSRKAKIFTDDMIKQKSSRSASSSSTKSLSQIGTLSRVSSVLISDDPVLVSTRDPEREQSNEEFICAFPLLTNDTKFLGVMEFSCQWKILPEDMKLLDCFAVFAAVSLERSELQEIVKLGHVELQLKQYITQEERTSHDIPVKLRIPEEESKTIFTIAFDAPYWDGIGHYKVLWLIMDTFNLFKEFKITNEKFFKFISQVSAQYKKVPYHNWRHAVDVTQFVTYQLKTTQFDETLTKFDQLGFIIAAICHDVNHDGFTNVFNEKAETPLGILFKNQSVMETHHCAVAIGIISKEECNLFSIFDGADFKAMWNLIIQLILITDMAKHFNFLKEINTQLDSQPFDPAKPEEKIKMMQLILKCGDISNVSRPFELADKWCDVLCEEFFRQGDLEMANGMEYTSPLNDRAHLDKPKSQIGFYTFVCLPLFQTCARVFPKLQVNVDQVQSNLGIWKAATEQQS